MDIVYPYDGKAQAILYLSIQSMRKHFRGIGRIWVIGENPGEKILDIPDVQHLNHKDPFVVNLVGNVIRKLMFACEDDRISDPFLAVSDDVIALKDFTSPPMGHIGLLEATPKQGMRGNSHKKTGEILKEHGKPAYNYETHLPRIIHKDVYLQAMSLSEHKKDEPGAPQGMSLYMNHLDIDRFSGYNAKSLYQGSHPTDAVLDAITEGFISLPQCPAKGLLRWVGSKTIADVRCLEIGPGPNPKDKTFDTMDVSGSPTYLHDMTNIPYPIKDDTYDVVYASHCLEHVAWSDVDAVLREWRRILKPTGRLEVWVPDFAQIVKCYLYKQPGDTWRRMNADGDYMQWVNGRLYAYGPVENLHRCMFDGESLRRRFEAAGFCMVKELPVPDKNHHGKAQVGVRGQKMTGETWERISMKYNFPDKFNLDDIVKSISSGKPFGFVRYGDGEMNCIFGEKGHNTRHEHAYSDDMGDALRRCMVSESNYHVGMMGCFLEGGWMKSDAANKYLSEHPEIVICDALVLHRASIHGKLDPFFDALKPHKVTLVGPKRMEKMAPWVAASRHIVIPDRDCWNVTDSVEKKIAEVGEGVLLFCASMPAKVWIRHAWIDNPQRIFIDIGSAFDPYTGVLSRKYMRNGEYCLARRIYSE